MRILILSIIAVVILSACGDNSGNYQKNATGKPGECVIIISDNLWKGSIGDSISDLFNRSVKSLPAPEPILDIHNVPSGAFTSIFKTARNVVFVKIDKSIKEEKEIRVSNNRWAAPQCVIELIAQDKDKLQELISEKGDYVVSKLVDEERKRLMALYGNSRFMESSLKRKVKDKFGIEMNFPKGWSTTTVDTTNFSWIAYETPKLSQGVFIWTTPYVHEGLLTKDFLIMRRDEVLKQFVPGPTEGSYMTTEKRLPVNYFHIDLDNTYTMYTSGLWRLEGDFMGGPWVGITMVDEENQRLITIEGFVYAPQQDKRNYVRELEAIILSAKRVKKTEDE